MQRLGKILWWDDRDGNGIIKDADGQKFYFDSSVVRGVPKSKLKSGFAVRFEKNESVTDTLCAHKVMAANLREQARLDRELENKLQLDLFA